MPRLQEEEFGGMCAKRSWSLPRLTWLYTPCAVPGTRGFSPMSFPWERVVSRSEERGNRKSDESCSGKPKSRNLKLDRHPHARLVQFKISTFGFSTAGLVRFHNFPPSPQPSRVCLVSCQAGCGMIALRYVRPCTAAHVHSLSHRR